MSVNTAGIYTGITFLYQYVLSLTKLARTHSGGNHLTSSSSSVELAQHLCPNTCEVKEEKR